MMSIRKRMKEIESKISEYEREKRWNAENEAERKLKGLPIIIVGFRGYTTKAMSDATDFILVQEKYADGRIVFELDADKIVKLAELVKGAKEEGAKEE